ncbi:MAG: AMP-binding protein [Thermodesulfobacteriota bacterium]
MRDKNKNYTKTLYQNIVARGEQKRDFIEFFDNALSYRELLDCVQRLTSFFRSSKLTSGMRIIIMTRRDRHAVMLFTAALLEGLVPVTISADTKSERAEAIIKKSTPGMIFIDDELREQQPWLSEYRTVSIVDGAREGAGLLLGKFLKKRENSRDHYPGMLSDFGLTEPACASKADDIAYILFSSGTTSEPKGILTTHGNLFEHLATITRVFDHSDVSRVFNNLPLTMGDGLVQGPMLALYTGGLQFRPEQFTVQNLDTLLNQIYSRRITHMITVPTVLSLIDRLMPNDDYFEGEEFSCLLSTAAKLDENLWQRFEERFGVKVCNMYGLTETVSGGLFCGPGDDTYKVGTVGKPIDMDVRVADSEGRELPASKDGELWLRGDNVTPGYLDDPEGNKALFSGSWLRTGDMARESSDGYIEIVGRIKAMIVSGGYNIHPDEITEVLMRHPDVTDAVTVGIPDDDWGELVVSAVISNSLAIESDLINHCREYLEAIKVPKAVITAKELPRGRTDKVILSRVRELIAEGMSKGSVGNTGKVSSGDIIALAAAVFNTAPESLSLNIPSSRIPGWDSLGHLNLISSVEESFNIQFAINEMMSVDSLQRLFSLVEKKIK